MPKLQDLHPRELFSLDYSSCWVGSCRPCTSCRPCCSAALEHPPASSEGLSTRSPGRSTLLPAWPGLPAKSLAVAGTGPVPRWSTAGLAVRKALCVHVCMHLAVCAREHPQGREGLQHGRMEGQSWASSLLPSSSRALCPEKPYLN